MFQRVFPSCFWSFCVMEKVRSLKVYFAPKGHGILARSVTPGLNGRTGSALKERCIRAGCAQCAGRRFVGMRRSFRTHDRGGSNTQGVALGWYADAPLGLWADLKNAGQRLAFSFRIQFRRRRRNNVKKNLVEDAFVHINQRINPRRSVHRIQCRIC